MSISPMNSAVQQQLMSQPFVNISNTGYGTITATPAWSTQITVQGSAITNGVYAISSGTPSAWSNVVYNDFIEQSGSIGLYLSDKDGKLVLQVGRKYELPDGTIIEVDDLGNFTINDSASKVVYKANRNREFNRFVNASDLLAKFIEYVRSLRVDKAEIATLPLALFVNWLVLEAAEADDDEVPEGIVAIPQHKLLIARKKPRCEYCKKFIPKKFFDNNFNFCNPQHAQARYHLLSA